MTKVNLPTVHAGGDAAVQFAKTDYTFRSLTYKYLISAILFPRRGRCANSRS